MLREHLIELSNLSSGTIARLTGLTSYEDQDRFINWLFKPISKSINILNGELADLGPNLLFGCQNAFKIYKRYKLK